MSYRRKHIKSKLHAIKPRKSLFKMLWFWLTILFLIIILSVAYFVIFFSGLQLKNINISGNSKVSTQDIYNVASQGATIRLFNFKNIKIISNSLFLIDQNKIDKNILNQFPAIEKVTIEKHWPQTLSVSVVERKSVGVFCPSNQTDNSCFLIDQNGIIFENMSGAVGDNTIVRQNNTTADVSLGDKLVGSNIMKDIYDIKKNLQDSFHINLTQALISTSTRVDISTSGNWKAYFDLSSNTDIGSQLKKLDLLLGGGISPDSMNNLRYVDLRPKDRAIVCDNSACAK